MFWLTTAFHGKGKRYGWSKALAIPANRKISCGDAVAKAVKDTRKEQAELKICSNLETGERKKSEADVYSRKC
ncbi:MAG: hypothetical protein WEC12_03640 [Balneolaceae bacterium]